MELVRYDRQLNGLHALFLAAQHGQSHGEAGVIGKLVVIADIGAGRGEMHRGRCIHASVIALQPFIASAGHAFSDEIIGGKRQDNIKLAASGQNSFCNQNVCAASQRTVANADAVRGNFGGDPRGQVRFRRAAACEHMAAIERNGGVTGPRHWCSHSSGSARHYSVQ